MYLGPMMTHFKQSMIGTMVAQQWPKACIMFLKYLVRTLSQLTVCVMPMMGHFSKICVPHCVTDYVPMLTTFDVLPTLFHWTKLRRANIGCRWRANHWDMMG